MPALYAAIAVLHDRVSGLVDAIRRMHSSNEAQFTRYKKLEETSTKNNATK